MNENERKRIIKIAKMYYIEGFNYQNISKRLNLSSAYISRLLKMGREAGLIEIRIKDIDENIQINELSKELTDKFGLKSIFIQESVKSTDVDQLKKNVAKGAAVFLYENIEVNATLGISWGTTILNTVNELMDFKKKNSNVTCMQLCGNLSAIPIEVNGINLVAKMSEVFNGKYKLLSVPAFVDNEYIKEAIMTDSHVKNVFSEYNTINYSISSVGSLSDLNYSTLYSMGYLDRERVSEVMSKDAVGDVLFYFFTIDGEIITPDFSKRFIRIDLEDYQRIPNKIIIATGKYKVKAIYGAIKALLGNILITDIDTAQELVKLNY
jgi:DNA-binding transcriptional regulator LsrR (DeoR family)